MKTSRGVKATAGDVGQGLLLRNEMSSPRNNDSGAEIVKKISQNLSLWSLLLIFSVHLLRNSMVASAVPLWLSPLREWMVFQLHHFSV